LFCTGKIIDATHVSWSNQALILGHWPLPVALVTRSGHQLQAGTFHAWARDCNLCYKDQTGKAMIRQEAQGCWKNGRDKASQHPWCQVWLWKDINISLKGHKCQSSSGTPMISSLNYIIQWMNHTTILDICFMENAMNSYQNTWISTYQEQVKRISSMNSWYEIMVVFMNSCFCVWIHTYQEQVKAISSHEIILQNHSMNSWCGRNSLYEIMFLGYDFKPLLEDRLFMLWLNTMKFWMKFGVNSWCNGMNLSLENYVLNSCMNFMYELIMWTKWTKDREGEQEICPYKRKVEQVLLELLAD
jgi:hypothetical protein